MKPSVKEVIVVEGKYDKDSLLQVVDATVLTCDGFSIFNQKQKQKLFQRLAKDPGIIILSDSDGAGLVIRNFIKGIVSEGTVKQAYIPQIPGKEKRKEKPSKAGLLGVEGMKPQVILDVLKNAGATMDGEVIEHKSEISKADFLDCGLIGPDSQKARKDLCHQLEIPDYVSPNALLDICNVLFTREEFLKQYGTIGD